MNKPAARPEIFSVSPYIGGEAKLPGYETPLKLSSNECAFGPPPSAIDAIKDAAAHVHRYPDLAQNSAPVPRAVYGCCHPDTDAHARQHL